MALVNHVSDIGLGPGLPLVRKDLVKNPEHLVRIDRTESQIIIGIAPIVEVKSAKHVLRKQPCHNLFNVLRLKMMTGINQDLGLRPGKLREVHGHSPVRNISVVERRLEGLVLH